MKVVSRRFRHNTWMLSDGFAKTQWPNNNSIKPRKCKIHVDKSIKWRYYDRFRSHHFVCHVQSSISNVYDLKWKIRLKTAITSNTQHKFCGIVMYKIFPLCISKQKATSTAFPFCRQFQTLYGRILMVCK